MCPVWIANTAAMVAGAGSAGGVLAVCIGVQNIFQNESSQSVSKRKGEIRWQ
jgi:hypothetical protein